MMEIFLCKMCGRTLKSEKRPNFCYADRMDGESNGIEGIDFERARQMGIDETFLQSDEMFEFPGDIRFDPFTGKECFVTGGRTLDEFQYKIMMKLWKEPEKVDVGFKFLKK